MCEIQSRKDFHSRLSSHFSQSRRQATRSSSPFSSFNHMITFYAPFIVNTLDTRQYPKQSSSSSSLSLTLTQTHTNTQSNLHSGSVRIQHPQYSVVLYKTPHDIKGLFSTLSYPGGHDEDIISKLQGYIEQARSCSQFHLPKIH